MHAFSLGLAIFWAILSYILYVIVYKLILSRRNGAKARDLQCQDPPLLKNKFPLGLDQIHRSLQADKAKQFPVLTIERTKEAGGITFKYKVLGSDAFFTADEKNIQAVLATQFNDFELGRLRRDNFFPLLGNGIFSQDGKGWEHSRALMRPQFARDQVSDLELEERHVQNLMRALQTSTENGGWTDEIDLQVNFFRLTIDSATEFLFGESINSQIGELPSTNEFVVSKNPEKIFASAFDRGQATLATRARFFHMYWLINTADFRKACQSCHEFIDHFVRLALNKECREKELENGDGTNSRRKYVFLEALATQTQDPLELRSQLLHILLAGRDTTASLLGWLFFCLVRDSPRYTKLRASILDDFGSYSESGPDTITFPKLKSCHYLQHCINETLRLYPVVPFNSRRANKDTTLPRGGGPNGQAKIFVPAGTQVDYSVHVMHHRQDIWGPDAEEFRPERWEGRRVGWEFLPFNGGPRICIGQQFALTEASYVVVRLLQRFDTIQNMDPELMAKHNLTLTNCSANGVRVKLREAV